MLSRITIAIFAVVLAVAILAALSDRSWHLFDEIASATSGDH